MSISEQHLEGGLWVGEWLAEPSLDRISRDGAVVKLEPRTMRLLMRLAQSPAQVVSAQQLLDHVWSGVIVGPASVYQAISQLRKLLGDTDPSPTYIATVPRKGYRLVAPVRRVDGVAVPGPGRLALPAFIAANRRWWIAGAALAAIAGLVVLPRLEWAAENPRTSIVVLPFADMTAGGGDAAFCDGLTEELSTTLSQLPSLRVVARTSAFSFRGQSVDVREVGRRLAATHVLEGSVRRSGDAVRVTAQLVDARGGYNTWSEVYDLPAHDILRLQSDIARSVAKALEIRFPEASSQRIARRPSVDPAAYELYLRGRHYYRRRSPEANARAIELNARAVELDPRFALAYVGLAEAKLNEFALSRRPMHELEQQVRPLLEAALRLDPDLPDAYATRGLLRRDLNQLTGAKEDLRRAIALDPNNAQAIVNLGRVYEYEGLPLRALDNFSRARALDPLDFMRHVDHCVALRDLGRYQEAAASCAESRTLQPESEWPAQASGWLARAQGHVAQALQWNNEALRIAPANPDLYSQRFDDLLDLSMIGEASQLLRQAQQVVGDEPYLRIRNADILLIEAGREAAREYLSTLPLDGRLSAFDLLAAVQISLSADDPRAAQRLAALATSAPDFATVELAHRAAIKSGTSYQLPLAMLELRNGQRQAAMTRLNGLLRLLDELERNGYVGWGIHSVRADALALSGDADAALIEMQRAVELGWRSTWAARHDPYLTALFEREDFRALMESVEQLNAAERSRYAALTGAIQSS